MATKDAQQKPSLVPDDIWQSLQDELGSGPGEGTDASLDIDVDVDSPALRLRTPGAGVAAMGLASSDLFAPLSAEHRERLAASAHQVEVSAGGLVFREGDIAESLYIVLDGVLELSRQGPAGAVAIGRVQRGEPAGLLELFYSRERVTRCRAQTNARLLEIPSETLTAIVQEDDALRSRVLKDYEERLVWGFIVAASQVTNLDPSLWARLMARFTERALPAGAELILPGEVTNLLTVVVSGELHLERRPRPGQAPQLQSVLSGQFLAVTSALSGEPCRLRVFAPVPTIVMEISHRDLAELLREFPSLRSMTDALTLTQQIDRDVYCGDTQTPTA